MLNLLFCFFSITVFNFSPDDTSQSTNTPPIQSNPEISGTGQGQHQQQPQPPPNNAMPYPSNQSKFLRSVFNQK
jgi:hypothetical protein